MTGVDVVPFRQRRRPRDVTTYIGMVIFLGGWAMCFAGLFFVYAVMRFEAMGAWPPPGDLRLPIAQPAVNTAILTASSFTMILAIRAARSVRPGAIKIWLGVTFVLGAAFLALQFVVWRRVYLAGLHADTDSYGSVFYGLTCFHALHVAVGLIGLLTLLPRALRNGFSTQNHNSIRMWAMYWHFVDVIWLLMFASVYVL
jgi:cytochrome c oxidase subunit 3